jgi:hypothetical protein
VFFFFNHWADRSQSCFPGEGEHRLEGGDAEDEQREQETHGREGAAATAAESSSAKVKKYKELPTTI